MLMGQMDNCNIIDSQELEVRSSLSEEMWVLLVQLREVLLMIGKLLRKIDPSNPLSSALNMVAKGCLKIEILWCKVCRIVASTYSALTLILTSMECTSEAEVT